MLCIHAVASVADGAAIVGDSARRAPFLVFIKHSLYPNNHLPWSQSKSESACKPRSPDPQPRPLPMLPLCPLSLPKSCHFFLFPPPRKLTCLSNRSLCYCRSSWAERMKIGDWTVPVTLLSFILTSGVPVDVFGCTSLRECPLSPSVIQTAAWSMHHCRFT